MKRSTTSAKTVQSNPLCVPTECDHLTRNATETELALLVSVRKTVDAANAVLDSHGEGCADAGCELCKIAWGVHWSMNLAVCGIECHLPASDIVNLDV